MNFLINAALRIFGFGKALDALNGETSKTYAAGAQKMLTGMAGIVTGLSMFAAQFIAAKGGAEYLAIIQGLTSNPAMLALGAGWALFLDGKATVAQRHALVKATAEKVEKNNSM